MSNKYVLIMCEAQANPHLTLCPDLWRMIKGYASLNIPQETKDLLDRVNERKAAAIFRSSAINSPAAHYLDSYQEVFDRSELLVKHSSQWLGCHHLNRSLIAQMKDLADRIYHRHMDPRVDDVVIAKIVAMIDNQY